LDPEGIAEMRLTIQRLHREMGLTILLSSHLLTEVEQLCTRIAVLNQGRKVFEGPISEARTTRNAVALRTPDFAAAVTFLRERGFILGSERGQCITLREGVSPADISRVLVTAGIPVEGIWQQEQTLEDFYLNLIKPPASPTNKN
jgi:ABC-2 type transport system ATP-binding protein